MDEEEKYSINSHLEAYPRDQYSPDLSSEDSFVTPDSFSSSGRRDIDISPNVDTNGSNKQLEKCDPKSSNKQLEKCDSKSKSGRIDTSAPFESVKEAVSKFGDIADWKAHRAQKIERRKFIEKELEKAHEEIPIFKQKSELAELGKQHALKNLYSTIRLIHQLKLNLERAETEEHQAKQDSELAQLRLQELEQGITDHESSVAAKTQLEVAKARHKAAASELITANNELEETRKDYETLTSERDSAVEKAEEAVSAAKELEEEVENLTIQLITTRESIETIHASHLEAEEHRMQETNELDQEISNLEHELQQTEDELHKVKQEIALADILKSKLETASRLLHSLKNELSVYMQGNIPEEQDDEKFTRKDIQKGVAIAKKNLDEVNRTIERTTEEIMSLKTYAKSLTAKVEGERQVLMDMVKNKGGGELVMDIESEMKQTRLELENIRGKEKEAREKLKDLPNRLQKASEENENAKMFAEGASLVLKGAEKQAKQSKSGASSLSSQLAKIEKEIESARARERLALGAISACKSESAGGIKTVGSKGGITVTLEEYYDLSKRAHEAEEEASNRVAEAKAKAEIDEAKESEMETLKKLTQLNSEISKQKEALNVALQKAEMAKESKSNIEDELKRRNGEYVETRKDSSEKTKRDSASDDVAASGSSKGGGGGVEGRSSADDGKSSHGRGLFKKKRFMPKISLMFMGKKKWTLNKKS